MDNLTTLANQPGRGLRIYRALIADDATGPNDPVNVRILSYDPSRNFGPCHWDPRALQDGSTMWPMRNDECMVALDEHDQAEILLWWSDDPTTDANAVARLATIEAQARTRDAGDLNKRGAANGQVAVGATTLVVDGAGGLLDLTFTPEVNCWWEVVGSLILSCSDNAWVRIDPRIQLTSVAGDARGPSFNSGPINICPNHVSVVWKGRTPTAKFKLNAGQPYTARIGLVYVNGTWQYYTGFDFLSIQSSVTGFW